MHPDYKTVLSSKQGTMSMMLQPTTHADLTSEQLLQCTKRAKLDSEKQSKDASVKSVS